MAKIGRPATGETPIRRFRSGAIWDAAKAKADIERRTMTDVLNEALRKYAATPPKPPAPPAS